MHLYVGSEWASRVYYDGSGDIVLLNEHELEEEGASYQPTVLNAGPHHGAAVPLEDDLFAVTIQHPDFAQSPSDYRLPIGAEIWDLHGHSLHRAEGCPDLHGDAGNGHTAVFGCTGGVLMVEAHDGHYHDAFIPGPAGSPDDFRLTSVWGYYGLDHFFALGSAVGLYVVEPEEGEMEQLIPATDDLRPIQVAISHDGELLVVVMSDGEVRLYEAHDLDLLASSSDILTGDIDPGFWARPHIATAPGHIFITNSGAGEVIALDAHDLEEVNHWEISGTPTKIAFVGILGEGDHHEEGHDDHDDHDDHGHDHGAGDPHFWQNPRMVVHYVNQITNGLVEADPDNAATYLDNSAAYIEELETLDAYIADTLAQIPADHRVMVTFHDAFGYFGTRYDMEVQAFVGGHGGDVSPDDIANVLELVEHNGLPAVFAEPQFSADALQQVARDAGIQVGIIRSLPDRRLSRIHRHDALQRGSTGPIPAVNPVRRHAVIVSFANRGLTTVPLIFHISVQVVTMPAHGLVEKVAELMVESPQHGPKAEDPAVYPDKTSRRRGEIGDRIVHGVPGLEAVVLPGSSGPTPSPVSTPSSARGWRGQLCTSVRQRRTQPRPGPARCVRPGLSKFPSAHRD